MSQLAVRLRRHGVSREQVDKVFSVYELEEKLVQTTVIHPIVSIFVHPVTG